MRYFINLQYHGRDFHGWQRQNNAMSIQGAIEDGLFKILRKKTVITGCGRTDAGVHASDYYAHMDLEMDPPFAFQLNAVIPKSIVVMDISAVDDTSHARFDAISRAYTYSVITKPSAFNLDTVFYFPEGPMLDHQLMDEASSLLLDYDEFKTFCKEGSDVKTYKCQIKRSEVVWSDPDRFQYHIEADRFLRGMVRLTVGMVLNVGLKKVTIDEVRQALDRQETLSRNWSVPAQGLILSRVEY